MAPAREPACQDGCPDDGFPEDGFPEDGFPEDGDTDMPSILAILRDDVRFIKTRRGNVAAGLSTIPFVVMVVFAAMRR